MENAHSSGTHGTDEASIVARMRDGANAQLEAQKSRATDGLGSVAQAARETTQRLRDQHNDTIADYIDQAATQLERFSDRIKEKDISELVGDAQRLARRQPALFIGSAFALGLLGARFMKSSATGGQDDEYDYPQHQQYRTPVPERTTPAAQRTGSTFGGGPAERF